MCTCRQDDQVLGRLDAPHVVVYLSAWYLQLLMHAESTGA